MNNYLVTGAAGFIGSRVSKLLLDAGNMVYGVDNLNHAYDVRLKEHRLAQLMANDQFQFQKLDIADKSTIQALQSWLPRSVAGVINLAAWAGTRDSLSNPWVYVDVNMTGALNMFELCRQQSIPKFVQASTSSVYGEVSKPPYRETDDPLHPLQPYAATKIGAEALAHAYHHLYAIDVTVLRYFTVYGPAGRPDMVMFRFCKWIEAGLPVIINGDGRQTRGFTYVDDIARGTILALKPVGFSVINLGGHEVISINEMIAMLEERIGKKADIHFQDFHSADVWENHADVSLARELLDWQPEVSLGEGMTRLVDWYLQEYAWASLIETP